MLPECSSFQPSWEFESFINWQNFSDGSLVKSVMNRSPYCIICSASESEDSDYIGLIEQTPVTFLFSLYIGEESSFVTLYSLLITG